MKKNSKQIARIKKPGALSSYDSILSEIIDLLEAARRASARTINALMTATYWEVGRRIVEFEQGGMQRATYADALLKQLSAELTTRFGRGFSRQNFQQMRQFYLVYPPEKICQTVSGKLSRKKLEDTITLSKPSKLREIAGIFPLSWSHYVALLSVKS
jgi:hypothetical protein